MLQNACVCMVINLKQYMKSSTLRINYNNIVFAVALLIRLQLFIICQHLCNINTDLANLQCNFSCRYVFNINPKATYLEVIKRTVSKSPDISSINVSALKYKKYEIVLRNT